MNTRLMIFRKIILALSFILLTMNLYAQWTKEDSIWIEGVKSGRIKLELTPEAQKAIDEGRLLETERPNLKMRKHSPQLPISKEFTDIRPEEEETYFIDLSSLPPGVIMLRDVPDSVSRKSLVYVAPPKDYISMKQIRIGTSGFYITAHTGDLNPIVKDGQSKGGAMAGIGFAFSMEDLLRYVFMPSERAKKRNRKYATAWKYY